MTLITKSKSLSPFIKQSTNNSSKGPTPMSSFNKIFSLPIHLPLNSKMPTSPWVIWNPVVKSKNMQNNTFTPKTIGIRKKYNSNFYKNKTSSLKIKSINSNQDFGKSNYKLAGSNITLKKSNSQFNNSTDSSWQKYLFSLKKSKPSLINHKS